MFNRNPGRIEPCRIAEPIIASFRPTIRGDLIEPQDPDYDLARRVYNATIDRFPALIVRCVDAADVLSTINLARENGLTLAVRGGAHNAPGFGTCDHGVVCDLSRMRGVRVDPAAQQVRVEGGCCWGDVDHATYPFGMAVPCGMISTTGVGGLTLGGGLGYLTRRYGLTIDNLLEVDVALADGRLATASERQYPDLFWAVRGGGGNFGAVTSFLFRMNPVKDVYGGPIFWNAKDARDVMRFWRDLILDAPEELNGWFGFVSIPPAPQFPAEYHGRKMCVICWCYTGPLERAEAAFVPIRRFRAPAIDMAGRLPLPTLNSMFDPFYPPGLSSYWRGDFFESLSDPVIDVHLAFGLELPTPLSTMHLYPINGAAHRVGRGDTAWNYRNAHFSGVIVGADPDPCQCERFTPWVKDYWSALHPYSAGGAYVNMFMDEGELQVKASYGENYSRLAAIKAVYDPGNLFRVNQNIKPAQGGGR